MLLAVDIGNTTVKMVMIDQGRVHDAVAIETRISAARLRAKTVLFFNRFRRRYGVEEAVICSVVPAALKTVRAAARVSGIRPRVIGETIQVPIVNRYADPGQVGQDRLVGAYAASVLYGVPAVVVDLGTAITFDAVSKKAEYLGGMIAPGIRLALESLAQGTALLPRVAVARPRRMIGKTTDESILSGIFFGYGAMIDGVIRRFGRELGGRPRVILTGGFSDLMRDHLGGYRVILDQELIVKGIELIASQVR